MALFDRYAALPSRLQLAVRTWLGLGIVCLLLPASAAASVGVLAQPWFWGLLPLLALLPYRTALLPQQRVAAVRRVQGGGRMLGQIHAVGSAA